MSPTEFWQNFKLGEEQEIACNFIYDALRNLHEMDTLSYETEIFPVLYNLSVGIERLLKVAIVLVEFDDSVDVNDFEKSLITHNHIDLLNRLNKKSPLSLGKVHIELLALLSIFYKSHRYDRFNLQSIHNLSKDKKSLHNFLHKHLGIDITEDFPLTAVWNDSRIKKFLGKTVKRITKEIYKVVSDSAHKKNIYTYEISGSGSKAAKILWGGEELNFEDEDRAIVEAFIFLTQTKDSLLIDFIKEMKPLELDPAQDSDYFQLLLNRRSGRMSMIMDEMEARYEEIRDVKDRLMRIDAARDSNIYFGEKGED